MKRGVPLRRKTRLRNTGRLNRQSELTRQAVKPKRSTPKPADTAPSMAELRPIVFAHANGCCDMCGNRLPFRWECHHRKLKSQGGPDELTNLLALDYRCHAYAHKHRTWAGVRGYIVHSNHDPAAQQVLRHGTRWEIPTDSGWIPADPPDDYQTSTQGDEAA